MTATTQTLNTASTSGSSSAGPEISDDGQFYRETPDGAWKPTENYRRVEAFWFPPKSRTTYILLAIFLGALGIHNFYAGKIGSGLSQILITLLLGWMIIPLVAVWFWTIVEACVVDTDGRGRKFA